MIMFHSFMSVIFLFFRLYLLYNIIVNHNNYTVHRHVATGIIICSPPSWVATTSITLLFLLLPLHLFETYEHVRIVVKYFLFLVFILIILGFLYYEFFVGTDKIFY